MSAPKGKKGPRPQGGGKAMRPELIDAAGRLIAAQMGSMEAARRMVAEFHVSERQAHRYLAIARLEIAKEHDEHSPRYKHYLRASLKWCVRRGMAKERLTEVIAALDKLAKLDGLYETVKVGVTHDGEVRSSGVLLLGTDLRPRTPEAWLAEQLKAATDAKGKK